MNVLLVVIQYLVNEVFPYCVLHLAKVRHSPLVKLPRVLLLLLI